MLYFQMYEMKSFFLSHNSINKCINQRINRLYSDECPYYVNAIYFAHFGKLQIIFKISSRKVKMQVHMILDTLFFTVNNIFPG